jgi:selenoprotein W-related protein
MTEVEIKYCVPCGYLPTALDMVKQLLSRFGHDISALKLVPGENGVFDVSVDGELVFSKHKMGRFPEVKEIEEEVKKRIS